MLSVKPRAINKGAGPKISKEFGSLRRFLVFSKREAIAACRQCIAAGLALTEFQPLQKQILTVFSP
jgi:hypothetical protein